MEGYVMITSKFQKDFSVKHCWAAREGNTQLGVELFQFPPRRGVTWTREVALEMEKSRHAFRGKNQWRQGGPRAPGLHN